MYFPSRRLVDARAPRQNALQEQLKAVLAVRHGEELGAGPGGVVRQPQEGGPAGRAFPTGLQPALLAQPQAQPRQSGTQDPRPQHRVAQKIRRQLVSAELQRQLEGP